MTPPSPHLAHGLWGVLATPFRDGGARLDLESLRAQVRLYRGLGATGLVALGVFGEGAALDGTEQRQVVREVCDEASGTPVVAGVSALATAPAIEQARGVAAAAGPNLAAVMVQVNTADPATLSRHLSAVQRAVEAPIVIQDYPVASGVRIPADALLTAMREVPRVAAVKSEAPPTAAAIAHMSALTEVPVFGGLGGTGLLDELWAGAAGVMTGFSHPEGLRATLDAWYGQGLEAARAAFRPWLPLVNFEAQPGIGLAVRKEILHQRGLISDPAVRAPARPLPDNLRPLLRDHVKAAAALIQA
jgi:4-hydroxy-tetrahydrodipicolinate synthase